MVTIGLDEARADVIALLDDVERGKDVLLTRRPRPVAGPVAPALRSAESEPAERETMREALRKLAELRNGLCPLWNAPSADFPCELRDERC